MKYEMDMPPEVIIDALEAYLGGRRRLNIRGFCILGAKHDDEKHALKRDNQQARVRLFCDQPDRNVDDEYILDEEPTTDDRGDEY